jgi:predicted AAA+ superfamily ATPase
MLTRLVKIPASLDFFLFGARSTGKTTLLSQIFHSSNTATFNLLSPSEHEQFQTSPDSFRQALIALPGNISNVIVDEIQRVPVLLDVVQEFMGQKRFRFILTGSSARKLKRGHANLLGGRAVTRKLEPLCFPEIPDNHESFEKKLLWGGLPKVFLAENADERNDLLRSYVHTYLAEEVVAEQLVRQLTPFRKFLQVAAQMNGKIINTNSIGRDIGTSHNTVSTYFDILEDTLIGFSLPAYSASVRKRVHSKNKFYLFDTGVCRALARTTGHIPLPSTSYYGDLFEHLIICELRTLCSYLNPDWELFYYRTVSGTEIDLIIDTGGTDLFAIEIKSASDISKVNITAEIALLEEIPATKRLVLSQDPFPKQLSDKVSALPWRKGLSEIFGLPD